MSIALERGSRRHMVDAVHGQPVCRTCVKTLDANLTALAEALNMREKQHQSR